jgi:hypothetical protein
LLRRKSEKKKTFSLLTLDFSIAMKGGLKRIIVVPGNGGGGETVNYNWYGSIKHKFENHFGEGVEVIVPNMPDPMEAKETIWIPFLKEIGVDEHTLIIGHSSGAVCGMRLAGNCEIWVF